ncbi:MAG: hypothetical protein JXO49_03470 [Deltaproteobacteria bacterium]|nr:hypothetical protein [Candidatus Anaeroferrophillus wilburensis]MBN2888387.1 hypothetical protein [Deltaproteobacteria bacterium]
MKKVIIMMCIIGFAALITVPAFAGGDKNHGSKGKGSVVRNQKWVNKQ